MWKWFLSLLDDLTEYEGAARVVSFSRDLLDEVVMLSVDKAHLARELSAANTRAAKYGALAFFAFGLLIVEGVGAALWLLPK